MVETFYTIPNAPSIALLSDIHNRPSNLVIRSLERNKPSLICICGDVLYGSMEDQDRSPLEVQTNVLPFLSSCAAIAPTYLSLGNHEWMLDEGDFETIRKAGVTVLDNTWCTATIRGEKLIIGGVTSGHCLSYRRFLATLPPSSHRYPRKEEYASYSPNTDWMKRYASTPGYHICLCHQPEYFPSIPKSVELVLSGHAHGGQWAYYSFLKKRMCGLFCPGMGFFPKWTKGVYEGNRLVVSAGLANTTKIPRIFNPTEVVYVNTPST